MNQREYMRNAVMSAFTADAEHIQRWQHTEARLQRGIETLRKAHDQDQIEIGKMRGYAVDLCEAMERIATHLEAMANDSLDGMVSGETVIRQVDAIRRQTCRTKAQVQS